MLIWLILVFTTLPVLELLLLIELGKAFGTWMTIFLVLGTGVIGAVLAKAQGLLLLGRIRKQLSRGVMPAREMVSGLCVLIGGVLLLTPGVLTDIAGILLLLPPIQYMVGEGIRSWLAKRLERQGFFIRVGPSFDDREDDDR